MKFIKHLVHDAVLWTLLLICFFNLPYAHYAENIISFYGIFMLVIGTMCIFIVKKVAESLTKQKDFKPRGKAYWMYCHLTTVFEVAVVAAMGWWWVAAGFVIYSLMIYSVREEADKIYDTRRTTETV